MKKLIAAAGVLVLGSGVAFAEGTGKTENASQVTTLSTTSFDGTQPLIPKGYRLAWTDGRLNPLRGVGTPAGDASMRLIWTDDVPARLVSAQD